jgi:DHA2 family multidrug resistance protein
MVTPRDIILLGLLQGTTVGFTNLPVTTIAFSTLDADLRTEASGFYNLIRNMGSAAGISITSALLVRTAQINHGYLAEFMTPFRHADVPTRASGTAALELLNADITRQAIMIGYINVFITLAFLCLMIIPVVMFLRVPRTPPSEPIVLGE